MQKSIITAICLGALAATGLAANHSAWSAPIAWDGATAVESPALSPNVPTGLAVIPNPAASGKTVSFQVQGSLAGRADLKVYDLNGKVLASFDLAGRHAGNRVAWTPAGKNGKPLASGVYLARLRSGSTVLEQKFLLLK